MPYLTPPEDFSKGTKMSSVNWTAFFQDAGISSREAKAYSAIFAKNNIGSDLIQHLDRSHLKDMGIIAVGDVMRIMLSAKKENVDKYITRKDITEQRIGVGADNARKVEADNMDEARLKEESKSIVGLSLNEEDFEENVTDDISMAKRN